MKSAFKNNEDFELADDMKRVIEERNPF